MRAATPGGSGTIEKYEGEMGNVEKAGTPLKRRGGGAWARALENVLCADYVIEVGSSFFEAENYE
jgi:hypothetical protein